MLRQNLQRKPPGLNATPKAWWVKEIAAEIYVSGRLSDRQIKYAAEAGFESLVSLYEDDDESTSGNTYIPSTSETEQICIQVGLEFSSLVKNTDEWASQDTVEEFEACVSSHKKPVLFYANAITQATYIALLYVLKQSKDDGKYEPKIEAEDFYRMCAALGMVPVPLEIDQMVDDISGTQTDEDELLQLDTDATQWTHYWQAQHINKSWFTAGQIRKDDIDSIRSAGFKTIVNMRLGVTHNDKPSQEQVTLLNIPDSLKTFSEDMKPNRQVPEVAENNRIKPDEDPTYVDSDSEVNFETRNEEEFGDDIGYNEEIERDFIKQKDIDYHHIPIVSGGTYDKTMFDDMKDTLLQAANKGPVLMHCRSATRVAYFGVLIAAVQGGRSLQWALQRLAEMGFQAGPDQRAHIYHMYKEVLG